MSRIGKRPIPLPKNVTLTLDGQQVTVKGPKGQLSRVLPPEVNVAQEGESIVVKRRDDSRPAKERHGLCRTLLANMVEGVSQGFTKKLEIQGVGYRAQLQGKTLVLSMGYSHPVEIVPPEGITLEIEDNQGKKVQQGTIVLVSGIDKELVGNTSARIRAVRPPEPYKGKGIRYMGEFVRRKVGKTGKK
ncbi:50S ribosomal protein L6 [Thermosynechococcus sp. QKsg1]|uniref:50S ribosomal protein L6 n=1 Tax=unclassified Thermosynechococcus TaxID=2622553 RepID=UPI00122E07FA|nr:MULTISPECIES: 50S ribosomal protein L6 [unclassified Thermosynechococcus]QEQ00369.1 50S ribosomal protein L6 [Thermosynechococcus sp. CL-1]WJI27105.1 50S ribosomal protein L6 [Thermosynechococcus sp. B1]WKT84219.1 50S ribosomal protein L6 [Thermosynechococcus sp. HY596]WNC61545.1 50S ribosomal protein L6 [Thermosynechococcus sp. QS41]WNC63353.1 50S ribosomal protein L6 [Thermosynechococcus sp. HY591]